MSGGNKLDKPSSRAVYRCRFFSSPSALLLMATRAKPVALLRRRCMVLLLFIGAAVEGKKESVQVIASTQ